MELRRSTDCRRTSSLDRAIAIALLCFSGACGNPAGPSGGGGPTTFSGEVVVADAFGSLVEVEGEFRDDGRLRADLTWRVVAPGTGAFGSQRPGLLLEFFRSCPGFQCPGYASAGPATEPPLSVAGDVHPTSLYVVRITRRASCGGCRIEYTLRIEHPSGSVRARS